MQQNTKKYWDRLFVCLIVCADFREKQKNFSQTKNAHSEEMVLKVY